MQTSITKISMKINSEESPVKAYVSIVLNNSVKINGIKLVSSENGKLIVVLPENSEKKSSMSFPWITISGSTLTKLWLNATSN